MMSRTKWNNVFPTERSVGFTLRTAVVCPIGGSNCEPRVLASSTRPRYICGGTGNGCRLRSGPGCSVDRPRAMCPWD